MKILGISGTIVGSKTLAATQKVLDEMKKMNPDLEVELLDLKQYKLEFCDGRPHSDYNEDTRKVIELVSSAEMYVIGTPIFQASIPGTFKNLIDLIPPEVFHHKIIGFIATGGNQQHYLVIENQLKPIAGYFNSFVAPSYVFVHNKDFNEQNQIVNQEVLNKITNLVHELCSLSYRILP